MDSLINNKKTLINQPLLTPPTKDKAGPRDDIDSVLGSAIHRQKKHISLFNVMV